MPISSPTMSSSWAPKRSPRTPNGAERSFVRASGAIGAGAADRIRHLDRTTAASSRPQRRMSRMKCALVGSRYFGATVFEALRKEEGVVFSSIVVPAADDRLALAAKAAGLV